MTALVKNNPHFPALFDSVFSDFFAPNAYFNVPAVNVVEHSNGFRLEVAAPGLKKEDFKINLDNNTLTLSAQKEQKTEETTEKYTRKEFSVSSFRRSFTLPRSVDGEKISANYVDGVLLVELPKKEEAKAKEPRTIEIA
ncbi:MAG: Hsp20/alpha crystallin family protein [Spirosomaceae bacterium]|jgi:HSP20 family protein|nr:Hsp20/alpha crystallin family protein [Spirosomataceae bacterium]